MKRPKSRQFEASIYIFYSTPKTWRLITSIQTYPQLQVSTQKSAMNQIHMKYHHGTFDVMIVLSWSSWVYLSNSSSLISVLVLSASISMTSEVINAVIIVRIFYISENFSWYKYTLVFFALFSRLKYSYFAKYYCTLPFHRLSLDVFVFIIQLNIFILSLHTQE